MAAEIVQSVSRSNSERRYLPSRDISSIAGIILSRNLVASYNGSGKPGVGKIEDDFYCAIRADIDADIKCTRRETRDEVVSFPRLPSPKDIALSEAILYTRTRTMAQIPARVCKPSVVVFSSNRRSVSYFYSIMHTPLRYENY